MPNRPVVSLDTDLQNADWTKYVWDLSIDNVEDLRDWLMARGTTVAQFKALPVYLLNVTRLPWLKEL